MDIQEESNILFDPFYVDNPTFFPNDNVLDAGRLSFTSQSLLLSSPLKSIHRTCISPSSPSSVAVTPQSSPFKVRYLVLRTLLALAGPAVLPILKPPPIQFRRRRRENYERGEATMAAWVNVLEEISTQLLKVWPGV
ncbi:hypothetical protein PROFUN_05955 [Planoprotostelium fungivorum]|uniref:Uncharacterized protein n=1 Tax=Planoprotostelium fungivorum TaxID=1890364 RepID=A0A2P6N7Q2_9EUKA|nr:hypothetical protein PROFUN_05955 [Planoprotostelium fungivorum]